MTNLRKQRIIAARVLGCGLGRVGMDPTQINNIEDSITAADIRKLVKDGIIYAKHEKSNSGFRIKKKRLQKLKGRRKGKGSKMGNVAGQRKNRWMKTIRAIRKMLNELKDSGQLTQPEYRQLYYMAKSGLFKSKSYLVSYIEKNMNKKIKTGDNDVQKKKGR